MMTHPPRPSGAPLPVVGSSRPAPGLIRRIGDVALAATVIAAWMGLIEALLVTVFRDIPERTLFLRQAIVGYAAFGFVAGVLWGAACELLTGRRGGWRRRPFYLISLFLWILLFQIVLHTHVHWSGFSFAPGSATSIKITALEALPALAIMVVAWLICVKVRPPGVVRPILSRPVIVILAGLLGAITVLPWLAGFLRSPTRTGLPNILMIVLDTTRVDRLSAYGYGRPTTPALERVAAEGVTFRDAYAAAPWTLPSHASIFTGELPTVHNANWEHPFLDDRLQTLAEHLAGQGLVTAAFAHQAWLSDETGLMRGFEHFHDLYWRSTTALTAAWRMAAIQIKVRRGVEDKGAAIINATFMDWIRRHGDESFFAFINYMEPHASYEPPSPYRERFLDDHDTPWGRTSNVAPNVFNAGKIEYPDEVQAIFSDLYDGAVAYQDSRMGEMLDFLRDRELLDDTLLIITADHGENLGDHGLYDHQFCVYNTLLHVPLVVRLPGVVPKGAVSETPVENRLLWSMIDMIFAAPGETETIPVQRFETALRVADETGGPILSELYQRPLDSELWKSSTRRKDFQRRLRSVQLNRIKYIWASDGRDELYDLVTDPAELVNLAALRHDDLRVLRELLLAKVAALKSPVPGEAPEFSEELKRRLKSLGYLD